MQLVYYFQVCFYIPLSIILAPIYYKITALTDISKLIPELLPSTNISKINPKSLSSTKISKINPKSLSSTKISKINPNLLLWSNPTSYILNLSSHLR